jgi:Domain of unknown function (DUF5664)
MQLPKPGTTWLHLKTGGVYMVVDVVKREADLAPLVIYQNERTHDGEKWSRPADEFLDGRFKELIFKMPEPPTEEDVWPTTGVGEDEKFVKATAEQLKEGVKLDMGKARIDLVAPELIFAVAIIGTFGAVKYTDRNWEKGMKWGRIFAALMRHLWAWWGGKMPTNMNYLLGELDDETKMSHLWHAGWCVMALIAYEQRGVGTDDRMVTPDRLA